MPISAQQWRVAVGRVNASRTLRPFLTGRPRKKLTLWDLLLFIIAAMLEGILLLGNVHMSSGRGHVGSEGRLVSSLHTALQRKLLLMLAGDVESNPGPYHDYSMLDESDLDILVEGVSHVSAKWETIGQELGLSSYLSDIRTSCGTSHNCLKEMFRTWLCNNITTTWRRIFQILRKVDESQLADQLKAKYIPDLLEMSDLNLLVQELRSVKEKWHDIGKEFGFTPSLSDIRVQYSDHVDCLREILRRQLQYDTTTWRNIVDALRSPCVHEAQLADQLQAKFCPNILGMSHLDLLVQELAAVCEKWQYIGEEIGVGYSISDIRTTYSKPEDCLREVLHERLQRYYIATWADIIAVLRSSRIGESHLADDLEAKYCSTAQKILEEALKKGYVLCHIWKVLVTGGAGSGKTSLKHCLFEEEPPSLRCSTALAEAAIRAISREVVGTDLTGWFRVTYEDLMKMLGEALKAGIPLDTSPHGVTGVAVHKQPTKNFTIRDSEQSNVATAPESGFTKLSTESTTASVQVTTTSASASVSSSKQELVQLVAKSHGSKRFLELQWIHFIDSGGQPQFQDVLPAFIRNTTATIFVMKLSERLDEHSMVEYYNRNGELCGKRYRHALSNNQMLQCCIQTILSQPSTWEGKHSRMFVVGTHRDLESFHSESRIHKNRTLVDMLKPIQDQLVYYHLGSEVIFPINAKNPTTQDQQVCAMIRKAVEDKTCTPPPYKIPIGWFLLEQDIIKAAKGGVISRKECLDIAGILSIKEEALKAALEYFDDLNIFLYYPSILPEVVFCNPQVLLNKVTELVHFSCSLQSDSPPIALGGKWLQFRDKGIVTVDMFQDERFSAHYIRDLFTPAHLIELFKHLLIVAPLSPLSSTEYFMPSLLQMISTEMIQKQLPPPSTSAAPLLVHFPAGCAQNGVFCALVVYLLSKCQWKFACDVKGNPLCVFRSCVHFQLPGKPVCIVLADTFAYFEVHVKARDKLYSKVCPMVREAIFSGLKAAAEALRYNNYAPVPAFFCKCSSPPHAATPVIDDEDWYLMCSKSVESEPLMNQHAVWLDAKLSTTDIAENDGSVVPPPKKQRCDTKSSKPTQKQLLQELYNTVPDKWHPIGMYLGIPEVEMKAIEIKHRGDPQKCLMAMLTESWLPRVCPPPTWPEIAEAIEFVGYPDVAQKLREKFCS